MTRDHIEALVHRYSDAVVHRDESRWSATWSADARWDLGRGRQVEGRAGIVDLWRSALDGLEAVVQTVANGSAELDHDAGVGTGRWYFHEALRRSDGTNELLIAHYDDRYVRVDDEWLFSARALVVHYQGPPDLSGSFQRAGDL